MLLGLWIAVLFGHAEVNNMDDIGCFTSGASNKEVVGFDISVDQVLLVNSLNTGELGMLAASTWNISTTYHLLGDHDNGLDGESAVAVVEEVFETGTEKVNHQNVVKTFLPKIVYIGNTGCNSLAYFQ